ncbi:DUF3618 domain-containing protein [Enterovirga sp. CN4-39]|uniref:DUF3618 domain-containing protein n=1 Tax=Enterovirga sp. CN4-39 TaxID=3400910 RepID=UPI003BFBBEC7
MASETSREIETEIEATRARLYGTIDRIQSRLTVAGIVDEVMGSAGVPRTQNGHDFVLGLMRRHPLPMMVAAAGLGYLIYRMNRQRAAETTIADVDYVEVPAINDGQARLYDPDLPSRHPNPDAIEGRWPHGAQA